MLRRGRPGDASGSERGASSLLFTETPAHPASFSTVVPLRLRHAPLLAVALCFALGELGRSWWQPPSQVVLCCALLFAAAAASSAWARRMALPATAVFWVALGWAGAMLEPSGIDNTPLHYADDLQRTVEGRVTAVRSLPVSPGPLEAKFAPQQLHGDEESIFAALASSRQSLASLDLELSAVEEVTPDRSWMQPSRGAAQVTLFRRPGISAEVPPCGALVRVTLRMHPPQRFRDPGVWQYADQLATRGISVQSNADAATLRVLDESQRTLRCRFSAAQSWAVRRLDSMAAGPYARHLPAALRLSPRDTGMLGAMLFGDRSGLGEDLRTAFERTGSFHLFVVAGLHIAVLLALLYAGLLRLRIPQLPAACVALAVTGSYALLTGFGAPAQRALLMSGVYLLTTILGRDRSPLNALGAAALTMLVLKPSALFESGFQLTVLAIFAIAGIAVPVAERTFVPVTRALRGVASVRNDTFFSPRLAQLRVTLRWMGDAFTGMLGLPSKARTGKAGRLLHALPALPVRCALWLAGWTVVTLCAEAVMALPMALFFHRATPLAAAANLVLLPLVGPLMLCAGIAFVASLVHPAVALFPAAMTAALMHAMTAAVAGLASLRVADLRLPGPGTVGVLAALALWCVALLLLRQPARGAGWAGCGLVACGLAVALWPRTPALHSGLLEFTAIDVGQGDALLAVSPGGRTMLIDAGGPTGSADRTGAGGYDIGEQVVSPYLWSRGLRRIDTMVLTHAHSDHIGGMAAVLRNFSPRELWVSVDADTQPFRQLLDLARERGVAVRHLRAGDRLRWDGIDVQTLNPPLAYHSAPLPTNDDSLVLRLRFGRSSVLAAGDAEQAWEVSQVGGGICDPVTLLKVGHHGSNTSTSPDLLKHFRPSAAVISCGRGNHFGHPRVPVLQRLQAAGIPTARTDSMGAVQYLLHADGSIDVHVLLSP